MHISHRGHHIQASPIRKLKPYADKAKARGIHVYHLNIGDPDVPTPRPVLDAFHAYNEPVILGTARPRASSSCGRPSPAISATYGIPLQADDVIVTTGGSEAIHFAFSVVADPGDEILIPEPYYTNYNGYASFASVRIVPLPLNVEDGFRLPSEEDIEARITPRTKAILLCSPNNPDGHRLLARGAGPRRPAGRQARPLPHRGRGLQGIHLRRPGPQEPPRVRGGAGQGHRRRQHLQAVQLLRGPDRGPHLAEQGRHAGRSSSSARRGSARPRSNRSAALAAYNMGMGYFEPIREEYQKRRDILYEGLKDIPGVVIRRPQGAFYIIARLPVKDAEHFTVWMLSEFALDGKTVMFAPAEGFYGTPGRGRDEVRMAYVLNEHDLRDSIRIFKAGLERYHQLFP